MIRELAQNDFQNRDITNREQWFGEAGGVGPQAASLSTREYECLDVAHVPPLPRVGTHSESLTVCRHEVHCLA
jgi:hypothetical protein